MRKNFYFRGALLLLLLIAVGTMPFYGQIQPDLRIRRVSFSKDSTGLFVDKVTVLVANECLNSTAGVSYVLLTFKQSSASDAKSIYYVGNTVKSLNGGESQVQIFDVSEKKIGAGRHIFAEVDPYKKVLEASETNNWYTVNPYGNGTQLTQAQCSAKM